MTTVVDSAAGGAENVARSRRSAVQLGAGAIAVIAWPTNPWLDLTLTALGLGMIVLFLVGERVAIGPAMVALALLILPPHALGEQSAYFGTILLVLGTSVCVAVDLRRRGGPKHVSRLGPLLPLAAMSAYWFFVAVGGAAPSAESALKSALIGLFTLSLFFLAPRALTSVLQTFASAVAALGWLVVLSVPAVLEGEAKIVEHGLFNWRTGFLYRTWADLAISNSFGFLELPRFTMTTGEPGLTAVVALLGLLVARQTKSRGFRFFMYGGMLILLLSSQSSGAIIIILVAGLLAVAVSALFSQRISPLAAFSSAFALLLAIPLSQYLFALKSHESVESITDRGFTTGSGAIVDLTNSAGRINALATVAVDGAVSFFIFMAMLVSVALHQKSRNRLFAALAVVLAGLALQPLHYSMSVWWLIGAAAMAPDQLMNR